jgi:osmotically-inducible protein OsmY
MNGACHLLRASTALLLTLPGAAGAGLAQEAVRQTDATQRQTETTHVAEVVVQASRLADEQITQQAETAIANDPYIFGDHITVTTRNGVVRVEGIVQDTGEWFRILRLCRKIPGTRRVVSELEMLHNDTDGG